MSVQEIQRLPRQEQLRLMETLWEELSRADDELESPGWHGTALAETAQRLAEGKEQMLEWSEAKDRLCKRGAGAWG